MVDLYGQYRKIKTEVDAAMQRVVDEAAFVNGGLVSEFAEALSKHTIDCAFVCTSPLSHADIIHECLQHDIHVFTEINLVPDRYDENLHLALSSLGFMLWA